MCLQTTKLKFLDMQNYLAAGTSLLQFYKSHQVKTPKGIFPYQWFDLLNCLDERSLPRRSKELKEAMESLDADPKDEKLQARVAELSKEDHFFSTLTNKMVSNAELSSCEDKWVE